MTRYASAEEMKSEVVSRLETRLKGTANVDADVLSGIVDSALEEIEQARNYPSDYDEETICKDMSKYFNNVFELALYDFNQIGAEGETSHTENGVTRSYKSRGDCFKGVYPIASVV